MIRSLFGRKACLFLIFASVAFNANSQSLPIDFENSVVVTSDFTDFDGGIATVIPNPQSTTLNSSATVAQIVRNGGQIWSGSKILMAANLDFSSLSSISMQVFTSAPIGTTVKMKLEGMGAVERDAFTTVSNQWETLTFDFTGIPADFNYIVFMFDYGNVGDGTANSTFLFDDIIQFSPGTQIDLPVNFEGNTVNYAMSDFGGNVSSLEVDPTDPSNNVMKVTKTATSATWAGTTISTPSGFATDIPLTLTDSKMNVRVWSPDAGILVQLKVEDANNNTHTCETQTPTTVAGGWEILEFDFSNEAPGTAQLSVGLSMGWKYTMASIFFNIGVDGATAGEKTYYFDDVKFGPNTVGLSEFSAGDFEVFPNPSSDFWFISSVNNSIKELKLRDVQGKLILHQEVNSSEVRIESTTFTRGLYFAEIHSELGIQKIKLVKN